jgi:hypothetical protein
LTAMRFLRPMNAVPVERDVFGTDV